LEVRAHEALFRREAAVDVQEKELYKVTSQVASELVEPANFVLAVRDSGYKSTAFAIAELIDNAIQAGAATVAIEVRRGEDSKWPVVIVVEDDGSGMKVEDLSHALAFGGSTRFDDRTSLGVSRHVIPFF
jgi:signal transduction histidine kinase